ncbi:MAG: hypothetical protein ACTS2F_02190 [Thainema sp.]
MGLFSKFHSWFRANQVSQPSAPPSAQAPASLPSAPLPTTSSQKTLQQLEQEVLAQYKPHSLKSASPQHKNRWTGKLIGMTLLVGVPVGTLWAINLPYPPIRRPIAENAPILLLPSYTRMDHSYRAAIDAVEQAKQLVDNATTPADIDLGAQKVAEAKEHLDKLPLWLWDELPGYRSWWWYSRMSHAGFDSARREIGRLDAKAIQERNAQTALTDAEQAIDLAKQQYQQANTAAAQLTASQAWQSALAQLAQVPSQTLAGRIAQQQLTAAQREWQDTVGLAASNQQAATQIQIARDYGIRAAQAGQNPPHSVEEWQRVENMWQDAIQHLDQVSPEDSVGYTEAQHLRAEYRDNLAQIQVRRQQEAKAVETLQQAQRNIQTLQANSARYDRNRLISQIQGIINQLKQIENGTTAYRDAQVLLLQAQNKLDQLQAQPSTPGNTTDVSGL